MLAESILGSLYKCPPGKNIGAVHQEGENKEQECES